MLASQQTLTSDAIRDTVAAVFRAREFQPRPSLWWWTKYLPSLRLFDSPLVRLIGWCVVGVAAGVVVASVVRQQWLARQRERDVASSRAGANTRGRGWAAAAERASRGDYVGAAHALFEALVDALAGRGDIVPHPTKTLGEYARELTRADARRAAPARAFLRQYERAIYGLPACDAHGYERLRSLATAAIQSDE